MNELAEMRNSFAFGTTDRERAEAKLVKAENILTLLEDLCPRLRKMIRQVMLTELALQRSWASIVPYALTALAAIKSDCLPSPRIQKL